MSEPDRAMPGGWRGLAVTAGAGWPMPTPGTTGGPQFCDVPRLVGETLSQYVQRTNPVVGHELPPTDRIGVMASRIAMLEFELTIARSLIADLSRRPTLEAWTAVMASAARPLAMADAVPSSHRPCRHCASMFLAEVVGMHEDMCEMRGEVDL